MSEQSADYLTETPYTANYHSFQSPVAFDYVARLRRVRSPRLDSPFRYCELGCGNGVTLTVLADAFPRAEFAGIDFNPTHIENARRLAARGGVGNVQFLELRFESLLDRLAEPFHFIALHGVYSWVSREVQESILRFVKERLAPNGIVYVTYNTMPGWASLLPIRDLLLDHVRTFDPDPIVRIRAGLHYLDKLREKNAFFFRDNPRAVRRLERMLKSNPQYLAHEFLTPSCQPLYFSQVAEDMRQVGLTFLGSANLPLNFNDVSVPSNLRGFLSNVDDRVAREQRKALLLDESFRYDLYWNPSGSGDRAKPESDFTDAIFGGRVPDDAIASSKKILARQFDYSGPLFEALIPAVWPGRATLADLVALPELRGFRPEAVLVALHELAMGGQVALLAKPAETYSQNMAQGFRLTSDLSRILLEGTPQEDKSLASPVLGDALTVNLMEGLLVRAIDRCGPTGALAEANAVLDELATKGKFWVREGRYLDSPDVRLSALEDVLQRTLTAWAPLAARLGVVQPAAELRA